MSAEGGGGEIGSRPGRALDEQRERLELLVKRETERRARLTRLYLALLAIPAILIALAAFSPSSDEQRKIAEETAIASAKANEDLRAALDRQALVRADANEIIDRARMSTESISEVTARTEELADVVSQVVMTAEHQTEALSKATMSAQRAQQELEASFQLASEDIAAIKSATGSDGVLAQLDRQSAVIADQSAMLDSLRDRVEASAASLQVIQAKLENLLGSKSATYYRSYAVPERETTGLVGTPIRVRVERHTSGTLRDIVITADKFGYREERESLIVPGEIEFSIDGYRYRLVFKNVLGRLWWARDFVEMDLFRNQEAIP